MAVHAGEAEQRYDDWFGTATNRTARMLELGNGGQVLVSGVIAALVEDAPVEGCTLVDLGVHVLRDLARRSTSIRCWPLVLWPGCRRCGATSGRPLVAVPEATLIVRRPTQRARSDRACSWTIDWSRWLERAASEDAPGRRGRPRRERLRWACLVGRPDPCRTRRRGRCRVARCDRRSRLPSRGRGERRRWIAVEGRAWTARVRQLRARHAGHHRADRSVA